MPETSPTLALPYLQPAQAQKHVTHNEALRILDAVTQLSVLDATLTAPPELPAVGDRYIVAGPASDAWAGHEHTIALWTDNTWQFFVPKAGWRADVMTSGELLRFDGANWVNPSAPAPNLENLPKIGVNATADDTNRLSVSSQASLFSHDGADHQLKVNKSRPEDTASLLFQTGFSGRAEVGTTGDDNFVIKISPDGSTFRHGLCFDPATGDAIFGDGTESRRLIVQSLDAPSIEVVNTGGAGGATFRMTDEVNHGDWKFKLTATGGFKLRDQTASLDVITIEGAPHTAAFAGPVGLPPFTVAGLPSAAAAGAGAQVFVTNESGGAVPAFSDGSVWRRVTDRAVVS